jgi:hypothetical protein
MVSDITRLIANTASVLSVRAVAVQVSAGSYSVDFNTPKAAITTKEEAAEMMAGTAGHGYGREWDAEPCEGR